MWLFATECLLAILLGVVACRARRYWCGVLLLFALCAGFCALELICAGTDDRVAMYMVPFVFGMPAIVVARGRFIAKSMPRAERERREEEAVKIYGPSPLAACFFCVLALLAALRMVSAWTVVDLDGGRVRVERRTWWGLRVQETEFPRSDVATVEVAKRERRTMRGGRFILNALVFRRSDGTVLGTTGGGRWGFRAQEDADTLAGEIRKGADGRFHACSFVRVGPSAPYLLAFLTVAILFGRGLVRPRSRSTPPFAQSRRGGVSLAGVLKRPRD